MIKSVFYGAQRLKTDVNDALKCVIENVTPKQRELTSRLYARKNSPEFLGYLERRADVHATEFEVYFSKSQKKADRAEFLMSIINAIHDDELKMEIIEPDIVKMESDLSTSMNKPVVIDVEAIEKPMMLALPEKSKNSVDILSCENYMLRMYNQYVKTLTHNISTNEVAGSIDEAESCNKIQECIPPKPKRKVNRKHERIDAQFAKWNEYFNLRSEHFKTLGKR